MTHRAASVPQVPEHLTAWDIVRDAEPSVTAGPSDCTDACIAGECDCSGEGRVIAWRVDIPALRALLAPTEQRLADYFTRTKDEKRRSLRQLGHPNDTARAVAPSGDDPHDGTA